MSFLNCAFEVPSIALHGDNDDENGEYKSHFEKPYRYNSKTSAGRSQSSKRRGDMRGLE